jgi:hypothetical protein
MADMGTAVTTAVTTGASTDKIYLYRSAQADGSRDAYITVTNLVAQVLATLGVTKIQAGTVTRENEGTIDITFDSSFTDTNYFITGSIKAIDYWDGTEEIRFPPGDRAVDGCVLSIQSNIEGGIGTVTVDWIAVELAS